MFHVKKLLKLQKKRCTAQSTCPIAATPNMYRKAFSVLPLRRISRTQDLKRNVGQSRRMSDNPSVLCSLASLSPLSLSTPKWLHLHTAGNGPGRSFSLILSLRLRVESELPPLCSLLDMRIPGVTSSPDHRKWLCVVCGCVTLLVIWSLPPSLNFPSHIWEQVLLCMCVCVYVCVCVCVCVPTFKQIWEWVIAGFIWADAAGQEEAVWWYWIGPCGRRLCWWLLYWLIKECSCFFCARLQHVTVISAILCKHVPAGLSAKGEKWHKLKCTHLLLIRMWWSWHAAILLHRSSYKVTVAGSSLDAGLSRPSC